jgi:DNA-binding Lrp family transcriptional regulator
MSIDSLGTCPYNPTTFTSNCRNSEILPGEAIMGAKAFILIETMMGRNKEVVKSLSKMKIKGIKSVDTVTGPYDAIAVLEAETLSEIGEIITSKIHAVDGISRTVTCLAV